MLILFNCLDKSNQQNTRLEALQEHLSWVEKNMNSIKVAGPQLHESTKKIIGSLYIIEAESIEAAHKIFQTDPYYTASIWQLVSTTEFKGYAGTWVGGKNWPSLS